MRNNSNFKIGVSNFKKTISIITSLSLRNERAWIIISASSLIITIICFIGYTNYSNTFELLPPQMTSLFLIPSFVTGAYFSSMLFSWKDTSLIKRLKFIGTKPYDIILSIIICSTCFTFAAELLNILIVYLISKVQFKISFNYLGNLFWWNWVWFIFVSILIQITVFSSCVIIMNLFNSKNIQAVVPILIIIFYLIMSDVIIPSFISTRSWFITFLGYMSITKYMVWILLITASFTFVDFRGGIKQIISDDHSYTFITNIYVLVVISIILVSILTYLSIKLFKWK
ncbi:hypothetical protein [Spiroplasma endosymbiont of Dioctria linearis]|uniref:hypothetical protein n=1 Tax=Spiroplasma endosymbiont of Dioctria linearis TaxID=3066290 RepID=UPI00313B3771